MRRFMLLFVAVLFTAMAGPREGQAATIATDAGWLDGTIFSIADVLPFDFTLLSAGVFSLTDCCAYGDTWSISGDFVGASSVGLAAIAVPLGLGVFTGAFDPAWLDAASSHFQLALAAGTYSIFVSGDGGGGLPASFGVRVDTAAVPVPAGGLLLLAALGGLGLLRRRNKAA